MPRLLIVAHAPSDNTRRLRDAILLGTTENFAYMSGAIKNFDYPLDS